MIYGYCRISRAQQNIERQIRNIMAEFPKATIVTETYTGTSMDRPQWTKLIKKVRKGDTLVFDSVSRMSRNADEGFLLYEKLFNEGINLIFMKEHHIDTATFAKARENNIGLTGTNVDLILDGINRYLLEVAREQIRIAFEQAEKEVQDLHQRTREGIQTAMISGKQIGRKKGETFQTKKSVEMKNKIQRLAADFGGTLSDKEAIELLSISRNTYYKYKRELKTMD